MKKVILIPIIIGGTLLIAGSTLFAIGLAKGIGQSKLVTNSYDLNESFSDFDFDVSVSSVKFEATTDGTKKVVCEEFEKQPHEVKVSDNTLKITQKDTRKWYEYAFNFSFKSPKITVYLPADSYGNFNLKSSTGDIETTKDFSFANFTAKLSTGNVNIKSNISDNANIESSTGNIVLNGIETNNIKAKASTGRVSLENVTVNNDINIHVSTGRVALENVKADNLNVEASTGYVSLTKTIINDHIEIKTDTGDVKFNDSDADTLEIKTDTGDVTGTLLTSKVFIVRTDTGKIDVPETTSGGLCKITTDTGDIRIQIKG